MKRVLSGIQPTADSFHLGNYLGAVKQWVELQSENDAFYCVVDLHALTVETDPQVLRKRTLLAAAQLIALGLDPDKCTLFIQSHVPEHNQLGWVLECMAGFGEANRMTQFKDKSQKSGADRTVVGLFTYPILQAADIMLYQANRVPVGEDQRQHIELTRSNSGVIDILDSAEVNTKKIKSAVTDAGKEVKFDEKEKPGISNLLTIHSALSNRAISDIENEFAGKGYGDFKSAVAEVVTSYFAPVKKRTEELLSDEAHLLDILEQGRQKARAVAAETLAKTYSALGLVPSSFKDK